jgi:hypothetical protein
MFRILGIPSSFPFLFAVHHFPDFAPRMVVAVAAGIEFGDEDAGNMVVFISTIHDAGADVLSHRVKDLVFSNGL